jgi:hypothetical protein
VCGGGPAGAGRGGSAGPASIVPASAGTTGPGPARNRPSRPPNDGGSTLDLPGRWWDSVHTFTRGAGEAAREEDRR